MLSLVSLALALRFGSAGISTAELLEVVGSRLLGRPLNAAVPAFLDGIIWTQRLPRVLLAYLVGAALSVSGAIMQSLLKNPLASSFTLGVSAGASLGAALVITGALTLPFAPFLGIPLAGFLFSLLTMVLVVRFSAAIDPRLGHNTVILTGMVVSLFISAILTLIAAVSREELEQLVFWQMGSFAMKGWTAVRVLFPIVLAATAAAIALSRELDILTFGDDEAAALGVPVLRTKRILITLTSVLTGCAVAFVGIVGFIDLIVPHAVRRLLGPAHRLLLPTAALAGGSFMVLADLLSRTILSPIELPVGAVTALAGAPFFAWIYLRSRRKAA